MNNIYLIFILIFFTSCVSAQKEEMGGLYYYPVHETPEAKAIREKKQQEEEKKSHEKIESEYKKFIKTNKCETEYWSRYEFGEYFYSIASSNKITPWEIVFGGAYKTRNISKGLLAEAKANFRKYLGNMPQPIQDMYYKGDMKSVFNISIQRDYECYKKLK